MFDFFKNRFIAKAPEIISHSVPQKELAEKAKTVVQLAKQRSEKQDALAEAAGFAGKENEALAFILKSGFADARLQAAMYVHSQEALLELNHAMRNTDRRVTKLVQEKLAVLKKQQKMKAAVQACLLQGQQLLNNCPLMVNQVAEWDKQRLALGEHGLSLLPTKEELETRLQAQLDLQRQAMQIVGKLRAITGTDFSLEQARAQLVECLHEWQEMQFGELFASLPKNQLQQLTDELAKAQAHVEQLEQVALAPVIQDIVNVKVAQRLISPLSPASGREVGREGGHGAFMLLGGILAMTVEAHENDQEQEISTTSINVEEVLAALGQALEEGSLQQALDLDKSLRKAAIPTHGEFVQRLTTLRTELNRLLDWAKWGGNVSREELINVAVSLVETNLSKKTLPAQEIAKQIGGLRARWKELDRTSGVAPQSLWERFDVACGRAYQIVDAHFKQQAQVRLTNLGLAKAQLAAMDEVILALQNQLPVWKQHQIYLTKMQLAWRKLGPIDRKLRTLLNTEFDQKITTLSQPLIAARERAINVRHQLITSVTAILPNDRDAVEKIQQAQQRWQQEALHLPLEQKDENNLWRQFRAACDAVFAQRKAKVDEQHQRRIQLNLSRQVCCEELEKSLEKSSVEIGKMLRKAKQEWRELSKPALGKHKSDELDARFDAALTKLEKRHAELQVEDKQAALVNLRAKINFCRQLEANTLDRNAASQTEWDALATDLLPLEFNKVLTQRFNNAMRSAVTHHGNSDGDAAQVEERLLRIELLRGIPSPPELAQQRLQLQVTELQSALKNRDGSNNYLTNFHALCALPVQLNTQQEQRFQRILDDYRL